MCYLLKNIFDDLFDRSRISNRWHVNTTENAMSSTDIFISKIWCLLMVQYLQNNVVMKWTTRFIHFTGRIPLKYGSTPTPPIITHCQKLRCQASYFTLRSPNLQYRMHHEFWPSHRWIFKMSLYHKTCLIVKNWRYCWGWSSVPLLWRHREAGHFCINHRWP